MNNTSFQKISITCVVGLGELFLESPLVLESFPESLLESFRDAGNIEGCCGDVSTTIFDLVENRSNIVFLRRILKQKKIKQSLILIEKLISSVNALSGKSFNNN